MTDNTEGKPPPRVLSIAGSDSSGGAGVQADIKTIAMLGGYAMSAITTVTAQNTVGVQAIAPMAGSVVAQQIASCIEDIGVDAIKIGMLHDTEIIEATADALSGIDVPIVLDPVMIATSGSPLIAPEAIDALRDKLFPMATLVTPNLPELAHLLDRALTDSSQMAEAAEELANKAGAAVLATEDGLRLPVTGRINHSDHASLIVRPEQIKLASTQPFCPGLFVGDFKHLSAICKLLFFWGRRFRSEFGDIRKTFFGGPQI